MTRYVDRFHPAAMVADFLDRPAILAAFRLINGVPGIAEAVIRWYGPIRATRDRFSKNTDYSGPNPLDIVMPLRAASPDEQRMALRYLVYTHERDKTGAVEVLAWGDRTPWVRKFADEWQAFCEAMLVFYTDLRYIDREDISENALNQGAHLVRPLRNELGALDQSPVDAVDDSNVADALLGSVVKNIFRAIRTHALFTLWASSPWNGEIVQEDVVHTDPEASDRRFELVRVYDDGIRRDRVWRATDDLVQLMVSSLYRDAPGPVLAFLIAVKNVMAALITADPTFVLRNSTRDTLSAFVLGRAWMVPVADTLRGAASFSVSNDDARQWFLQGGASSTLLETAADDPEHVEPVLPSLATRSKLKRFTRGCRKVYNLVTAPARALEAGTRIMQFRRMLNRGATPREAALASRAVEWLAWDHAANGPKAFPSGVLRGTGLAAFTASPYRSRSRWADDYYALAKVVEDTCYMARTREGQRLREFVSENRATLGLCDWKKAADKALRPFTRIIHEQGFANPGLSRAGKERLIRRAYGRRDDIYRRAYVVARDRLLNSL